MEKELHQILEELKALRQQLRADRPFICPVCSGSGQVPFTTYPMGITCSSNGFTWCATCKGRGIVWRD